MTTASRSVTENRRQSKTRDLNSVLWVDDRADDPQFETIFKAIKEHDVEIVTAISEEHCLEIFGTRKFDVVVIDGVLGPDQYGENLSTKLWNIDRFTKIVIFSTDIDVEIMTANLSKVDPFIILEHIRGGSLTSWTTKREVEENVLSVLRQAHEREFDAELVELIESFGVQREPLPVAVEGYQSMSGAERAAFALKTHKASQRFREYVFAHSDVEWIVVGRNPFMCELFGEKGEELPPKSQLENIRANYGCQTFVLGRPVSIQSITTEIPSCFQNYPVLPFRFESTKGYLYELIHFDTGSDRSFMSAEYAKEISLDLDELEPFVFTHKETRTDVASVFGTIRVYIGDQSNSYPARFRDLLFIEDWIGLPWVSACEGSCGRDKTQQICRHRIGLVGRDFIRNNQIDVTLKGGGSLVEISHHSV